ncbi:acylneuraminate cytidylyltransferase family protein [Clostridiaceae bacterium]|nr:acylneuraminate cytidylyltransferase family protein [Clostridiaceae bacterium]RKI08572.1 acylneuraminate cytidylyltransferase family protein [bacterium 1XD21-70]
MKNLAVIPARSGSKGLKDKNIRLFAGKPLMAYTIEAAKMAGIFDRVMVSTDSLDYAKIAKEYGAEVPFLRKGQTSGDKASSWDVVKEVLNCYKESGQVFDTVCLLQPTSPLRTGEDIKAAYLLFCEKSAIAVISVCETEHTPLWCNTLPNDNSLEKFIRQEHNVRRQDVKRYYRINGAIYFALVEELQMYGNLYKKGSFAYIMDQERSIDIDTELDFLYAELIYRRLQGALS